MRAEVITLEHERRLIDAALSDAGSGASVTAWRVADVARADEIPSDSFPGYEIVRELHRGGQGVVYQAIQKSTKRKVALKVLLHGPFAGVRDRIRFEREVQVLGQLQHPNIVSIHDSGVADGRFFYVMDYIAGLSLDQHVRHGRSDIRQTLDLVATIAEAVDAAHLRGVVHRDLKPANVRIDSAGAPHVLDFGLAKVAAAEVVEGSHPEMMTMSGQFVGSLPWASPEQAEGRPEKIDLRTDVYSLGVILFELLTGRFPYEVTGGIREALHNITTAEPTSPRTLRREINDEIATIILKCLRKERERRYQSAGDLARDIRRYLAGAPIDAKRDSSLYVLRKTLWRHKVSTTLGVAILTAGICFTGVMTLLFQRERATVASAERRDRIYELTDPDRGLSVNDAIVAVTLADMAARLDLGRDRPELEAAERIDLGRAFLSLGDDAEAKRHFARAVEIRERRGSPEKLAEALHNLAWSLTRLQESGAAEARYVEALEIRREVYGPDSLEYAETANDLGMLYQQQRALRRAEPHLRSAYRIRESHPLASTVDRVESRATLGELLLRIRSEEALRESEELLGSALRLAQEALGEKAHTVAVKNKLGLLYLYRRDFEGALAEFVESLEMRLRILPAGHAFVGSSHFNLALAYRGAGRFDEAVDHHLQAIRIWEAPNDPNGREDRLLAWGLMGLAETLRVSGELEIAEDRAIEALGIAEARPEPDAATIAEIRYVIARILMDGGDYEPALDDASDSLDQFATYDSESWQTARGWSVVGRCLAMLERFEDAVAALERGYELSRVLDVDVDPVALEAREWLAEYYERTGAPDEAARLRAED